MSDFRRMKWTPRGKVNSVAKKNLQPRISLIVAMDSTGAVYLSMLQANSNSAVMELFFSHLIKLLDKKKKNWRQSTVILLDNAPYH